MSEEERLLGLIETVEWMGQTLCGYLTELGELSPSELELRLGVLMKGSKVHERQSALLDYLDSLPANLRLQMRYERGMLVFGTFWLQGANGLDNKLFSIKCPVALAFYLDAPTLRVPTFSPCRELRAAWMTLAEQLGLKPEQLLERALVNELVRYHGALEAVIGDSSAVRRHREVLDKLAANGAFWQEASKALAAALESVVT